MKNASLPIAVVVAVIGCGLAINAYITSGNMRQNLEEERYKRMTAEEHLQNTKGDLAKIRTELAAAQKTLASIQDLINKNKDTTSDLKGQLDTVRQERDSLKQQLGKIQGAETAPVPPAPGN